MKTMLVIIPPKRVKYFGVNLAKEVKDLYTANYMTLMKEIESYTNNWKDILDLQIGRINIVKMPTLPKVIYPFKAIPVKISMALFTEIEQTILKFMRNFKRS